jgi:hypothetical protein
MKEIVFTTSNNPLSWEVDEVGSIIFASHEEAKKAERLFQEMQDEINRLRAAVPEERTRALEQEISNLHAHCDTLTEAHNAETAWTHNHEWPRLCADITGAEAIRWKISDSEGYAWKRVTPPTMNNGSKS